MLAAAWVTITVAVQPADTSLRPADFLLHEASADRVEMVDAVEATPFLRSPLPLSLAIVTEGEGYDAAVDVLAATHGQSHEIMKLSGSPHGLVADVAEARVALAGKPGKRAIVLVGEGRGPTAGLDREIESLTAEHIRVYVLGVDPDPHAGYALYRLGKLGDNLKTNRADLVQAADRIAAEIESEYELRFPESRTAFVGPVTLSVEMGTHARAQIMEAPEFLASRAATAPRAEKAKAPLAKRNLGVLGYLLVIHMALVVVANVIVRRRRSANRHYRQGAQREAHAE